MKRVRRMKMKSDQTMQSNYCQDSLATNTFSGSIYTECVCRVLVYRSFNSPYIDSYAWLSLYDLANSIYPLLPFFLFFSPVGDILVSYSGPPWLCDRSGWSDQLCSIRYYGHYFTCIFDLIKVKAFNPLVSPRGARRSFVSFINLGESVESSHTPFLAACCPYEWILCIPTSVTYHTSRIQWQHIVV